MSHCISLKVFTTFALLSCISTSSQGVTLLDAPASTVVAAPLADSAAPVKAVSAVAAIVNAASGVIPPAPVAPKPPLAVIKSPPTITPPKITKKAHRRVVVHHAKPTLIAAFNQPYTELGVKYTPIQNAVNYSQRGEATWYSKSHQGIATINGEIYDVYGMTAAHPTLPIPSYARVTNLMTQKSVVVRINDRGPFGYNQKVIDLSYAAANKIGLVGSNNRLVEIFSLEQELPTARPHKSNIIFKSLEKIPSKPDRKARSDSKLAVTGAVYLQLGAFKTAAAAQTFMQKAQQQLGEKSYSLTILVQAKLHRVRTASYPNAAEALRIAAEINKTLGFKPLLKSAN